MGPVSLHNKRAQYPLCVPGVQFNLSLVEAWVLANRLWSLPGAWVLVIVSPLKELQPLWRSCRWVSQQPCCFSHQQSMTGLEKTSHNRLDTGRMDWECSEELGKWHSFPNRRNVWLSLSCSFKTIPLHIEKCYLFHTAWFVNVSDLMFSAFLLFSFKKNPLFTNLFPLGLWPSTNSGG